MHGCILSTVPTDALVLKHQTISIHSVDWKSIVLVHFHTQILQKYLFWNGQPDLSNVYYLRYLETHCNQFTMIIVIFLLWYWSHASLTNNDKMLLLWCNQYSKQIIGLKCLKYFFSFYHFHVTLGLWLDGIKINGCSFVEIVMFNGFS